MSKNVGDLYLAEYNSLRGEQMSRIQTQNQSFNFLLIVAGAAITALITSANATNQVHFPWIAIAVTLMLPLAACPLGYMFFDNEIMIHAIGSYLHHRRRPCMVEHFGDSRALGNIMAFECLPKWTHTIFPGLSKGRWILFCVPTFLPVIAFPFLFALFSPLGDASLSAHAKVFILVLLVLIYLIDFAACVLLAMAIYWTHENDKFQACPPPVSNA